MGGCLSSTLIYANTGVGKTAQAGGWAKAISHLTGGKKIRYYTAEPGNIDTIAHLVEDGLIEVVDIGSMPFPSESLEKATQGYSPNGAGGWSEPNDGHYQKFGGHIFEGGTSFGECLLEELRVKGAANEIMGAEKAPQQYTSGKTRIAGSNQTHYGIVQGRLRKAINDSQRLPVHVLWTCRELKAEDDDQVSGFKEIYGPQLVGKAMTPHVPAWFGKTIHLDLVREKVFDTKLKKEVEVQVRKAFFKTHFYEGNRVPYIANPRLPVEVVDELPESVILKNDLSTMMWFFDTVSELTKKAKELHKSTIRT